MSKWQATDPTVFDIMGKAEGEEEINIARKLWKEGIDKKNEWAYYCDCFMYPLTCSKDNGKDFSYEKSEDFFILNNEKALLKINGLFENYYKSEGKPKAKMSGQLAKLEKQYQESKNIKLTREDGALVRKLMSLSWEWHIRHVFEYLGYDLEPKEEPDPFEEGNLYLARVKVACPRDTAKFFKKEFFTEKHKQKFVSTIGGQQFSTVVLWLSLKIIGAETAAKRNLSLYTYTWEDGSKQSYLKITADNNIAYIGSYISNKNKEGEEK